MRQLEEDRPLWRNAVEGEDESYADLSVDSARHADSPSAGWNVCETMVIGEDRHAVFFDEQEQVGGMIVRPQLPFGPDALKVLPPQVMELRTRGRFPAFLEDDLDEKSRIIGSLRSCGCFLDLSLYAAGRGSFL